MIDILLATYNGEKYIAAQLDSLLAQTESDFRILVSDDGSSDRTMNILRDYQNRTDKIRILESGRKGRGAAQNFMFLMRHSTADYVMFCDQDDCWLPYKVAVTLSLMRKGEKKYGAQTPLLVYTAYRPVDESLKVIPVREKGNMVYRHYHTINRLLIQNYVTGCTMMMNRSLNRMAANGYQKDILMHDWWAALCAAAAGHILYRDQVTMLYRQHAGQSVGAINVKGMQYRIRKILDPETRSRDKKCVAQAKVFLKTYGRSLDKETRRIIGLFAAIERFDKAGRVRCLLRGRYLKSDFVRIIGQLVYI